MKFTDDQLEAGRILFAGEVNFERGVVSMDSLPAGDLPEVAFAGRSNVGKSSLVNALTGRKALARASVEPGRTRELNYFRVGEVLRIVDLPGYGYAKAPKAEIARWTGLTRDFLRGRAELKRVMLLIDSRHGVKETDLEVMKTLDTAAVIYQVVLTKSDKLKPTELEDCIARTADVIKKRPAAHPDIIATSSETGAGIDMLRAEIAVLAS
ncbi:ribosome biogenesis GTP-binding protein YihA/YsxC [Terricaulis sp.]|uniref:ribosome biogenesis GTP-binding protein YihA/YsxC n=1 Tax=Terricaulis sp. TaxID=2768686 RepID=UPI00378309ED